MDERHRVSSTFCSALTKKALLLISSCCLSCAHGFHSEDSRMEYQLSTKCSSWNHGGKWERYLDSLRRVILRAIYPALYLPDLALGGVGVGGGNRVPFFFLGLVKRDLAYDLTELVMALPVWVHVTSLIHFYSQFQQSRKHSVAGTEHAWLPSHELEMCTNTNSI